MPAKVGAILELDTKEANQKVRQLQSEINKLGKKRNSLDIDLQSLKKARSEISSINTQITNLSNKKLSLQADVNSFNQIKQRITEIDKALANIKNQYAQIKYSDVLDSSTKNSWLSQLRKQRDLLQGEKAVLNVELKGYSEVIKQYKSIEKEISKLEKKKTDLEIRLKNEENVQKDLNEVSQKIAKLESDKAEIQLQLENYNTTMSQLNNIANKVQQVQSFGKGLNTLGRAMTGSLKGFSNTPLGHLNHFLVQGIGYSALYRMTSSFMNTISESFSGAISRLDTIANSKRTFQAMNFDDSVVTSSLDDLESRILGLPTKLNEAIQNVTMISSITNDLPQAVRIFDAFNNAILAFGGSQEQANRAITQFSQAMGTGKLDARTYLSLTDAGMSPALAKVAEMLGYSSENMGEFKSALGEGEISLEDFTDALILLNEQGYDTMKALNTLAKENAIKSIGSSITVAETQIEKGWGSIIQAINDSMDALGYGTIPQNIARFGESVKGWMNGIADSINGNRDVFGSFLDFITTGFSKLMDVVSQFDLGSFVEGLESFRWVIDGLKAGFETLFNAVKSIAEFVGQGDVSKGLGRIAGGLLAFGYAFRFLGTALDKGAGVFGYLAELNSSLGMKGKLAKKISETSNVLSAFSGKNKTSSTTDVSTNVKTFNLDSFKNSMANMAKMAMMAGNIMLYAEAIKQLDEKLPDDLSKLVPKLATLGVVMTAMAGLSAGMGKLTKLIGKKNELVGVASLIGAGGALWLFVQAIDEVNKKVPDDIGNFASKMANVVIAIGAMGIVVGALGGLASLGNGLGAVIMALGEIFVMTFAITLQQVAESISAMADSIEDIAVSVKKFGDTEIDSQGVSENMSIVTKALDELTSWSGGLLGALAKLAQQKIDEGNIAQASSNLNQLLDVADAMQNVSNIQEVDADRFETAISSIKSILETFDKYLPLPSVNTGTNNTDNLTNVSEQINAISTLVSALNNFSSQGIPQFDEKTLTTTIDKINAVVKKLKEIKLPDVQAGASLTGENAQNIVDVLNNLASIAEAVNSVIASIQEHPIDAEGLENAITAIADLLGRINNDLMPSGDTRIGYNMKNFIDAESIQNVIDALNNLSTMITTAQSFMETFTNSNVDWELLKANINKMMNALNGTIDGKGAVEIDSEKLGSLENAIKKFETIVGKLETISQKQINFETINAIITQIGTVLTNINSISGADNAESMVSQITNIINKFNEMLTTLAGMNEQFLTVGNGWGTSLYQGFEESNVSSNISTYVDELITTLKGKDFTAVGNKWGSDIVSGFKNKVGEISGVVSNLATTISQNGSFATAGSTLGNSFINAFNNAIANLDIPDLPEAEGKAKGGLITQYFSKGGWNVFKPKGTDTVPAMLTPGEFVIKKKAVEKVGVPFLKKINSLDLKGAFKDLVSARNNEFTNTTYHKTIIKNTTNNTDNRSINVYGGNERVQRMKAGRFMKCLA